MKLYLDCEFTQLSPAAKLISLALVAEDGREVYVELLDGWSIEDCSDFVTEIVFPQLWGGAYAMPVLAARNTILAFRKGFTEMVEIVTDAPEYDWELFCELTYSNGHWPGNVRNWRLLMRPRWTRSTMVLPFLIMCCWTPVSSPACSRRALER